MTSALATDLYDVIARRRDVRAEFSDQPIDPDALQRVLGAAHSAPSVGHSQPWDFVLVRDPATRERFRHHVATERATFADSLTGERQQTFAKIKVEGILESALGVVITYDPERGGTQVLGRHAIDDAGLYSAVLAIQNLWLAATAEGLGVGWVSFYREEFLRDLLGIPAPIRPIAWLCVGPVTHLEDVPDLERHGWRQKRPLDEAIHHEKYGNH
jgi:5,6-dimethylbenzimidazole synthase